MCSTSHPQFCKSTWRVTGTYIYRTKDQLNEKINGEMDKRLGELIQSKEPDGFPEVTTKKELIVILSMGKMIL